MSNIVYIATSLDGYIADKDGGVDWLHSIPNPEGNDFGFAEFLAGIDALVMGRNTYEAILAFDLDLESQWPYPKPVYVVSTSAVGVPAALEGKVFPLQPGSPGALVSQLAEQGHQRLYIDGGKTIQGFMEEGLVDEMIITQIPIVLGGGMSLFGELAEPQAFELVSSEVLLGAMVKNHYRRRR